MKYVVLIVTLIVIVFGGYTAYQSQKGLSVGADFRTFVSTQLAPTPTNTYILSTDGLNNVWIPNSGGGGGSSKWDDLGSFLRPIGNEAIIVNGTSTLTNLVTNAVTASTSAGLFVRAANGTAVADFGAGNTANSLFLGAVNINGNTRLATSLTGLLRADAGAISTNATGSLTENATGLEFSATRDLVGGSSILSLSAGYEISLIASTTNWNNFYNTPSTRITAGTGLSWSGNTLNGHAPVTVSGALDYITLVGQDIVRGAIDLATDITGILADDNGGTGQSTYATGDMLYASGVNTLAKRTIGSTGNVLSVVGGVPTWVATSTLGFTGGSGGGSGEALEKTLTQTSHGFSVGNVLKFDSNVYSLAQANTGDNAEVVGIVAQVVDSNNFVLNSGGFIDNLSGLTANNTYFLSATSAGALSITSPSSIGDISKPLLRAVSSTTGYVFNMRGIEITAPSSGGSGSGLATTTPWTAGNLAYVVSNGLLSSVATGTLTESITGLEFNATRALVGGSAILSLTSGYNIPLTASTTEWAAAYASTTALTPTYIRSLFSNTATGLTYTGATGITSLTAGYNIPLTASTTEWTNFYNTPSTRITAGTGLSWSGNTLNATGGGGGGIIRSVTVTSGNTTAGSTAGTDYVYMVAGAHTISLPAASGNTNLYIIKNNHTANITIDTVGTELIEGLSSISIIPEQSVQIISNGTNYFII